MTQVPDSSGRNVGGLAVGSAQVPAGAPQPAPQPGAAPAPAAGGVYGSPRPATRSRRRLLALLIATLVLTGALGSGAAFQLNRELPAPVVTTDIGATLRVPGKPAALPWPAEGSAELTVEGLDRLGGSGGGPAKPIGSVAKVMTAFLILREHPLSGDQEGPSLTVTAKDVADYESRKATHQSLVHVIEGMKLTQRDALEALMLPSANNIAHQLAVWDAGSEAAFVDKMNAAADELGMADTEYTDPSGFQPTTVSTAADQVVLGRAALKLPAFAEIVELPEATIPVAGQISNYNDLLGENGVFGIKTGSTDEAGGCLLFASRLKVGSRTLVLVGAVFNQPGANTPEQLAATNKVVRKLLTAVGRTVKEYQLIPATPVGTVVTDWGASATVSLATPLTVIGWQGQSVPVTVRTTVPAPEAAAGQEVGIVEASGVQVKLRTDVEVEEPSLWWRLTRLD
ncbi:D-alanyl-D-alanine carboxypeptidase family protein [Krasilnikovia sp. M28-CT-15]|uniref:D-alanyl-D-alanine carboxypeptidase family protein n=1 Tax=Krasilnikovia sp. M28-CT-15 TaxID=3373540 RepID=UPI00399D3CE6